MIYKEYTYGSRIFVDPKNPLPIYIHKEKNIDDLTTEQLDHNRPKAKDDLDLYNEQNKENKKNALKFEKINDKKTKDDLDLYLEEKLNPTDVYVPEFKKQSKLVYYLLYPFKKTFNLIKLFANTRIGKIVTNPFLLFFISALLISAAFLTPVGPFLLLGIAAGVTVFNVVSNIKSITEGLKTINQKLIMPFFKTKVGKILTSKLFRVIFPLVLLAATFLTPVGPIVAVGAIISLTSVIINVSVDIYKTRKIENLQKEHNLCVKNRCSNDRQKSVLEKYPDLKLILVNDLKIQNNNRPQEKYKVGTLNKVSDSGIKLFLTQCLNIAFKLFGMIGGVATGNVVPILNLIKEGAIVIFKAGKEYSYSDIKNAYEESINKHNLNPEASSYNNLFELKQNVRKQFIQTTALEELVKHPNYENMKPSEKREEFTILCKKIDERTKNITKKPFYSGVVKMIVRTFNPFHELPDIASLKKREDEIIVTKPLNIRNITLPDIILIPSETKTRRLPTRTNREI